MTLFRVGPLGGTGITQWRRARSSLEVRSPSVNRPRKRAHTLMPCSAADEEFRAYFATHTPSQIETFTLAVVPEVTWVVALLDEEPHLSVAEPGEELVAVRPRILAVGETGCDRSRIARGKANDPSPPIARHRLLN